MRPERRSKLLGDLNVGSLTGVELGPLADPAITKEDSDVLYVDHLNSSSLRSYYTSHGLQEDSIVEIDYVWNEGPLSKVLEGKKFDYVVASHVIEHVPDPIRWLSGISDVLKPNGTVRLAVPDKRFCFDRLRQESRTSDLLTAYFLEARRPSVHQVIDSEFFHQLVNPEIAWGESGEALSRPTRADFDRACSFATRAALGEYVDVHCWTFTPRSFVETMRHLAELKLVNLACEGVLETAAGENEFFVALRKSAHTEVAPSWSRIFDKLVSPEIADAQLLEARLRWLVENHQRDLEEAQTLARRLAAESDDRMATIERLRRSTSWRMTQPLRWLTAWLRRRR